MLKKGKGPGWWGQPDLHRDAACKGWAKRNGLDVSELKSKTSKKKKRGFDEVIVNADSVKEAMKKGNRKGYSDGVRVVPAIAISARPHPIRRGKYIVKIKRGVGRVKRVKVKSINISQAEAKKRAAIKRKLIFRGVSGWDKEDLTEFLKHKLEESDQVLKPIPKSQLPKGWKGAISFNRRLTKDAVICLFKNHWQASATGNHTHDSIFLHFSKGKLNRTVLRVAKEYFDFWDKNKKSTYELSDEEIVARVRDVNAGKFNGSGKGKLIFSEVDLRKISRNTDRNYHGENYEFIAKKIGSNTEEEFRKINMEHNMLGYLPHNLSKKRYALHLKLYNELKRKYPEDFKNISRGGFS